MALLHRFDPPAYLNDFDEMPGMREAWHAFLSRTLDADIKKLRPSILRADGTPGTLQFYNPATYDPGGVQIEQAMVWNAFPKELLRRFGRERALVEGDRLWPLSAYGTRYDPAVPTQDGAATTGWPNDEFYRPTVEYCEWHVERDALSGNIQRVTFTAETQEYWQALFGLDLAADTAAPGVKFPGDPQRVLELYRELVSPKVQLADLRVKKSFKGPEGTHFAAGDYNPYNVWNTARGIVHLSSPSTLLSDALWVVSVATALYANAAGQLVVAPDELVCCAGYGGPNRNSDPTNGATVNALARAGALVTVANPVGLYIDHIDTNGWELPGGIRPQDCIRVVRGAPGKILRLVVEVPPDTGLTLADLRIGGQPVRYGGQLAECVTVKLSVVAARLGEITDNVPTAGTYHCLIDPNYPNELWSAPLTDPVPPGYTPAFTHSPL